MIKILGLECIVLQEFLVTVGKKVILEDKKDRLLYLGHRRPMLQGIEFIE